MFRFEVDRVSMRRWLWSLVARETDVVVVVVVGGGWWWGGAQKKVNLWQQLENESSRRFGPSLFFGASFVFVLPGSRQGAAAAAAAVLQPRRPKIMFARLACKSRGRPSSLFCRRSHCAQTARILQLVTGWRRKRRGRKV